MVRPSASSAETATYWAARRQTRGRVQPLPANCGDRSQRPRFGAGQDAPAGDVRGTVPCGFDRGARRPGRAARPRPAAWWDARSRGSCRRGRSRSRAGVSVEQRPAVRGELREPAEAPPADEQVSVRKALRVSLRGHGQPTREPHRAHQRCPHRPAVEPHRDDPGRRTDGPAVRLVVEDPQRVRPGRDRVVLPCEAHARAEPEVAVLAAELPDDPSCAAVDLVDGPCVPARDEQVAVGGEAHRVHMEVVVGATGVPGGRLVAVAERHVGEAVPVEQDAAGGHVDLLDDAVVDPAVAGAAD